MNNNKGFFYNNCNKYGENSVNIISRQFELNELTILYFQTIILNYYKNKYKNIFILIQQIIY